MVYHSDDTMRWVGIAACNYAVTFLIYRQHKQVNYGGIYRSKKTQNYLHPQWNPALFMILAGWEKEKHTKTFTVKWVTSDSVYLFTSHPMTSVGGGLCVRACCQGGTGEFLGTKCTVLILAWCSPFKGFFMVRSALRVQYPYSNAIVQRSFSLLRLSSAVWGP